MFCITLVKNTITLHGRVKCFVKQSLPVLQLPWMQQKSCAFASLASSWLHGCVGMWFGEKGVYFCHALKLWPGCATGGWKAHPLLRGPPLPSRTILGQDGTFHGSACWSWCTGWCLRASTAVCMSYRWVTVSGCLCHSNAWLLEFSEKCYPISIWYFQDLSDMTIFFL